MSLTKFEDFLGQLKISLESYAVSSLHFNQSKVKLQLFSLVNVTT